MRHQVQIRLCDRQIMKERAILALKTDSAKKLTRSLHVVSSSRALMVCIYVRKINRIVLSFIIRQSRDRISTRLTHITRKHTRAEDREKESTCKVETNHVTVKL